MVGCSAEPTATLLSGSLEQWCSIALAILTRLQRRYSGDDPRLVEPRSHSAKDGDDGCPEAVVFPHAPRERRRRDRIPVASYLGCCWVRHESEG